ncbi:hypothetical protein E2C01_039182 [Portunus trituberculatus]|uniref:Uncharacterized protein n=1 Tax=Portunus trituberculatus TaxID=210409 RepID=A0A5B7FK14_PORTR|nr:hypothetical protein [Portunus trituberculatus]
MLRESECKEKYFMDSILSRVIKPQALSYSGTKFDGKLTEMFIARTKNRELAKVNRKNNNKKRDYLTTSPRAGSREINSSHSSCISFLALFNLHLCLRLLLLLLRREEVREEQLHLPLGAVAVRGKVQRRVLSGTLLHPFARHCHGQHHRPWESVVVTLVSGGSTLVRWW